MAQVFCHQDEHHRHDQQDRPAVKHRRGELRQAEPGRGDDAGKIHRLAHAQAVGQDHVDHGGDQQAKQDQQALQHAARQHGDQRHADEGDGLHPAVKVAGSHVLHRNRGQVQADHRHHGTGDDWRHQALDPARADQLHQQADQHVDQAADDDATQRHRQVQVGPAATIAGGSHHHADKGKAAAQIARHLAAGKQEEDERADAAHEDRQVRVETHQDGGQHGRAKHGDHVLDAHQPGLRPGQAFIGGNAATLTQHLTAAFCPLKKSHGNVLVLRCCTW